ncbi:Eyes absent-like protein 4 [Hordeum vulgare]|nr:Eyes absent-like protein 4 [Hordeum vulgare]
MPAAVDDDTANRFLENMVFEGGAPTADQVVLDGFSLDHDFPEDYSLEEEDDGMDIDGEPLFEQELANQTAARAKSKRESKRTKAYMPAEDKLLCESWRDIGQDPKVGAEQKWSALWTRVHREFHEHKKFHESHERKKFPPHRKHEDGREDHEG